MSLVLAACSGGETNVVAGNREGVVHIGNGTEPQSIDPHVVSGTPGARIVKALFEGLVTINPHTLQPEPGVAERWTLSPDRTVITFHLNHRARWSNGDPVTAEDFVWSWRRSLDPVLGNVNVERLTPIKNAQDYAAGKITDPALLGFRALDPHTFQVTLNAPTPYFLSLLDDPSTYPVHRATIEEFGAKNKRFTPWTRVGNMVNNGPFSLKDWQLNRRIEVEKNPCYWYADAIRLNGIVFHPIESDVVEERMYRAGQLHYTMSVPLNKIGGYRAMPDSPYQQAPSFASYYYLLNTTRAPVHDVRVRRALSLAIDREKLVRTVLQNVYQPLYSLVPPGVPGYAPPSVVKHDPARARELMAEAGHPDGIDWPGLEVLYNTTESHRKIAVALQRMWKEELNIDVTLANMEWRVYLDMLDQMEFTLARAGRQWSYLDPHGVLDNFIGNAPTNRTGFASERYDELVLETASIATTRPERLETYRRAEALLLEQVPIIPLFAYTNRHLVHPSMHGAPGNALDLLNFRYIWLESN